MMKKAILRQSALTLLLASSLALFAYSGYAAECEVNFREHTLSAQRHSLRGIAWNGSMFVGVGGNGNIMTSRDTYRWKQRTLHPSANLAAITWSGKRFVAVGSLHTSANRCGVIVSSKCIGAVGSKGIIATSHTGKRWKIHHIGFSDNFTDIAGHGKMLVAVGMIGALATSSDGGNTWKKRVLPNPWIELHGVTFGHGLFVAVGNNRGVDTSSPVILVSADGVTWTEKRYTPPPPMHPETFGRLNDVTWTGRQFIAVGHQGSIVRSDAVALIATSPDGDGWTSIQDLPTRQALTAIAHGHEQITAVGMAGTIITSLDGGIMWQIHTPRKPVNFTDIIWTGREFVGVGSKATVLSGPDASDPCP